MRNAVISTVALLVVTAGLGVGYVWYSGQQEVPQAAVAAPVAPVVAPVVKPPKLSANAPVSASIQMMNSSVRPGENVSLTVRTLPAVSCTIEAIYNEVKSTDSGLVVKKADDFGIVSWSWTVEENVPAGTWPVNVTCASKGRSAVVRGDLVVKPQ